MAFATVPYTGNGTNRSFAIPFPYIDQAHIEARVASVLLPITSYTFPDAGTILLAVAPATGATVVLSRNTPKMVPMVVYADASTLTATDLILNTQQALYAIQETIDVATVPDAAAQASLNAAVSSAIVANIVPAFTSASVDIVASIAATNANVAATNANVSATNANVATKAPLVAAVGRQRLLNGSFRINQRGYVSGTALAAAAYGFDRWMAGALGATLTFTDGGYKTIVTITAGSIKQFIEPASLEGGLYVISWAGSSTCKVNGAAAAASPIVALMVAGATGVNVEFLAGTLDSVQFAPGIIDTPFEVRSIRYELAECQRHYQGAIQIANYGYGTPGQALACSWGPIPPMRVIPTITVLQSFNSGISGYAVSIIRNATIFQTGTATTTGQYFINAVLALSADLSS